MTSFIVIFPIFQTLANTGDAGANLASTVNVQDTHGKCPISLLALCEGNLPVNGRFPSQRGS